MTTRLNCQAESCAYNQEHLCRLNAIKVDGPAARVSSQTCCDSFVPRSPGAPENAAAPAPDPETSIRCAADRCAYNRDRRCTAQRVYVGGDTSTKSGTLCLTFRPE